MAKINPVMRVSVNLEQFQIDIVKEFAKRGIIITKVEVTSMIPKVLNTTEFIDRVSCDPLLADKLDVKRQVKQDAKKEALSTRV